MNKTVNDKRPDPDLLLRQLQEESPSETTTKGKLKIFLGYAAGVGKTYRMLSEARSLMQKNVDVLAGFVETHGRPETEALLAGLNIQPRRKVAYAGLMLEELDLDGVLQRKPFLVLVDELAHTNAPGSRHAKRVQDVEELLAAGIHVYTTLNIQHIESVNDVVQEITGVAVRETVPNRVLDMAAEIELVDLPPEGLLQRLSEGKVYIPPKAEQAMKRFFRKGNLLALRELALRYTARQVDVDMRSYMELHAIPGPWHAGSRLLVSVSSSPVSQRLIRVAQRMAADLDAEWFAVYVESPQERRLSEKDRDQLAKNLQLAEELGGKPVTLSGSRFSVEILNFAKKNNVTLILAGGSFRSRWEEIQRGSVLRDLIRHSGTINVLVIGKMNHQKIKTQRVKEKRNYNWANFGWSALTVAFTVGLCWLLRYALEFVNIAMILLLPVAMSGIFWGKRIGIFASFLAVAALNFFFVPPLFTFAVADVVRYLPVFVVFVTIGITTSLLAELVRWQGESARQREQFVSALYNFTRELMEAKNPDQILTRAAYNVASAFQGETLILLPDSDGALQLRIRHGETIPFDERELGIATWVFKQGQVAGRGTETLSSAAWYYLPIKLTNKTIGVLGIHVISRNQFLSPEQRRLLDAFSHVIALTIDRSTSI
jgi:two-component system sensor histidine kinase KdpD